MKGAECWWWESSHDGLYGFDIYFNEEDNFSDSYDGFSINAFSFYCNTPTPKSGTYTILGGNDDVADLTHTGWLEHTNNYNTGSWDEGTITSFSLNDLGNGFYEFFISGKAEDGTTPIEIYYKGKVTFSQD